MKKLIIAIAVLMLAVTPAFADNGNHYGWDKGGTDTYTQTQNVFGSGAGSASLSGVAGWGCASAFAVNQGSAIAFGGFATSQNESFGMSRGNAGFLAGGISAAATFNYTNKITITEPKNQKPR